MAISSETAAPPAAGQKQIAGKYLTFTLASESYGVPVLKVREIITMLPITGVPQMPPHVKGVINLRGKVIPVIDLRTKLGLPDPPTTEGNCIVVVQLPARGGELRNIGLIVDAVEEVANVAAEDIEPPPDFGGAVSVEYLLGMAKVKGAVKSLLDIEKVISDDVAKIPADSAN